MQAPKHDNEQLYLSSQDMLKAVLLSMHSLHRQTSKTSVATVARSIAVNWSLEYGRQLRHPSPSLDRSVRYHFVPLVPWSVLQRSRASLVFGTTEMSILLTAVAVVRAKRAVVFSVVADALVFAPSMPPFMAANTRPRCNKTIEIMS